MGIFPSSQRFEATMSRKPEGEQMRTSSRGMNSRGAPRAAPTARPKSCTRIFGKAGAETLEDYLFTAFHAVLTLLCRAPILEKECCFIHKKRSRILCVWLREVEE